MLPSVSFYTVLNIIFGSVFIHIYGRSILLNWGARNVVWKQMKFSDADGEGLGRKRQRINKTVKILNMHFMFVVVFRSKSW